MDIPALLSGDAGAGAPRAALRSGALRDRVRRALNDLLDEPVRLGPCLLRRTKYKPGRRLTASFTVSVPGRGRRDFEASWRPEGTWPPDAAGLDALEEEARRRGLAAPFKALSSRRPHACVHLDVAPLDARFPSLVRLSDPLYAADVAGLPTEPTVSTVRYRPGARHVLRYSCGDGGVFVKLYRDDQGARVFQAGVAVAGHLAAGTGRGRAVSPIAYLPDDRALLLPAVKGVSFSAALRRGRASTAAQLREAGALLASMHGAPASMCALVGSRTVEDEVAATDRTTASARRLVPGATSAVDRILDGTCELLGRLPGESPVFTHGDFKADNLIVSPAGVTVVDLDRCVVADAALDLAKFLADLRWWLGDRGPAAVDAAQEHFLTGYGTANAARLARARALEPLQVVKQAARRIPVHEADWEGRTAAALSRANALLEGMARS